jgi:hypothetical protein
MINFRHLGIWNGSMFTTKNGRSNPGVKRPPPCMELHPKPVISAQPAVCAISRSHHRPCHGGEHQFRPYLAKKGMKSAHLNIDSVPTAKLTGSCQKMCDLELSFSWCLDSMVCILLGIHIPSSRLPHRVPLQSQSLDQYGSIAFSVRYELIPPRGPCTPTVTGPKW